MSACRVATVFGPSDEMPEADARAMADDLGLAVVRDGEIETAAESGERVTDMAATTTIETTPKADDKLALVTTGLEPSTAAQLRATFVPFLDRAQEWEARARAIVVTDISQKREMRFARESRLALRDIRVAAENARKAAKADALSLSKAIDGACNIVKGIIEPIERHLQTQEDFAKNYEAAEQEKVRTARRETLVALGAEPSLYSDLGVMSDEAWAALLESCRLANEAKLEEARRQEAIRVEAERIEAEQREAARQAAIKAEAERVARETALAEEAAKLRAEAAEREAAAKVERERVEAERAAERAKAKAEADAREATARAEREAHEAEVAKLHRKAEAERAKIEAAQRVEAERIAAERHAEQEKAAALQAQLDAKNAAEAARLAAEADAKRPTKIKYSLLARTLEEIACWGEDIATVDEPHAAKRARHVLDSVGLAPKVAKS